MAYYEQLTFTGKGDVEEAEETAIKLIRDFEELALQRCPDKGYIVGYSGGKVERSNTRERLYSGICGNRFNRGNRRTIKGDN